MRRRGVVFLAGVLVCVLATGLGAAYVRSGRDDPGPEKVADDYFAAWRRGALDRMGKLVAGPPPDFAAQHRALSRGLTVTTIALEPGPVVRSGTERAQVGFSVSRALAGRGTWSFESVLRLGRVDGRWRVLWTPATLYPGLKGTGSWSLREVEVPAATVVDRDGEELPEDGPLEPYVTELAARLADEDADTQGWAVELQDGIEPTRRVKIFGEKEGEKIRTTVDRRVQEAAEKAAAGAPGSAAIVAVRPSTGEILAVADRLGGLGAFVGLYPPGSTFKVVTAAALLADGMTSGGGADCPATVVTAQRTIRNNDGVSLGRTSLGKAFAQSCNTTFAKLGVERLGADKLAEGARAFGFGEPIEPGVGAARGSFPDPKNGAELAEASIGQGRVQVSPLVMAAVAGAAADGTWRPPRLVAAKLVRRAGGKVADARDVPGAGTLRAMMRGVVTGGTAEAAGLPPGTAGKTGTAEFDSGGASHAWFIGYRRDVAFAVLVSEGGSGSKAAAPLAAKFLRALD